MSGDRTPMSPMPSRLRPARSWYRSQWVCISAPWPVATLTRRSRAALQMIASLATTPAPAIIATTAAHSRSVASTPRGAGAGAVW